MMDRSLKEKSITGVKWSSISTALNSILIPIFYVLLALLLTPSEFAYVAVINLIYRLVSILVKFGIEEAYIQDSHLTNNQISSLFYVTILFSVFISMILYSVSSWIESLYNLEHLSFYIKLLLVPIIADGAESVFRAALRKAFFFKEWSMILMIRMISRILVTLAFIYFGFGALSIVIGYMVSTVISLLLFVLSSTMKTQIKIAFHFNMNEVKRFLKFGYPITGKNFFDNLSQRVDEIIIGSLFSTEVLGIYYFGKNLITQIKTAITTSFSMVLLPLYSKLKKSKKEIKHTYFSITTFTSIIGIPILIGVSLTADVIIPLIFGEEWLDSVLVIQILSIAIIFPIIISNNATSLLYSYNKPLMVFQVEIVTSIVYFTLLWGFASSMLQVLLIYSLFLIVKSIVLQYFVNKKIETNFIRFFHSIRKQIVSILTMIGIVLLFKYNLVSSWSSIPKLTMVIIVGCIAYLGAQMAVDKQNTLKLLHFSKALFSRKKPTI